MNDLIVQAKDVYNLTKEIILGFGRPSDEQPHSVSIARIEDTFIQDSRRASDR